MNETKYFNELMKMPAVRKNAIISAVNRKLPLEEAGAKNEAEKMLYKRMFKEAKEMEKKYGMWPVFEAEEIESDDPALDIYHD